MLVECSGIAGAATPGSSAALPQSNPSSSNLQNLKKLSSHPQIPEPESKPEPESGGSRWLAEASCKEARKTSWCSSIVLLARELSPGKIDTAPVDGQLDSSV